MSTLKARAEASCQLNTNKRKIFNIVSTAQKSCFIQIFEMLIMKMAFFSSVDDFQTALSACLTGKGLFL